MLVNEACSKILLCYYIMVVFNRLVYFEWIGLFIYVCFWWRFWLQVWVGFTHLCLLSWMYPMKSGTVCTVRTGSSCLLLCNFLTPWSSAMLSYRCVIMLLHFYCTWILSIAVILKSSPALHILYISESDTLNEPEPEHVSGMEREWSDHISFRVESVFLKIANLLKKLIC